MSHAPICPQHGIQLVERRRKIDGKPFYGCPKWPRCSETANHEDEEQGGSNMDSIDLD